MRPLGTTHRAQLRAILERDMDAEGAEAVLETIPTSDDDTPATKDFVKGQVGELRAEIGSVRGEVGSVLGEVGSVRGEMGAMESRIGDRFTTTNHLILIAVGILLTAIVLGLTLHGLFTS